MHCQALKKGATCPLNSENPSMLQPGTVGALQTVALSCSMSARQGYGRGEAVLRAESSLSMPC